MNKVIKTLLLTLIMLTTFCITMQVKANSFKLDVTSNEKNVKQGDTVTIHLKLSDIDVGNLGINTLEGKLQYDTNVFEEVQESDIKALNKWSIAYNSEDTDQKGKFLAVILADGVTDNQEIGTITLKVKNGIQATKTVVTISNIKTNNGEELINDEDRQVAINVGENIEEQAENTEVDQTQTTISSDQTENSNYKTGSSEQSTDMQNNGKTNSIVRNIIIIAVGAVAASIIAHMLTKGKKGKSKGNRAR